MDNFGVLEVATERRTVAPGWAYVPDTPAGYGEAAPATTTKNRKRAARNQAGQSSYSDLTSRQETKLRKELEALDRDGGVGGGGRESAIPIPAKAVKAQNKHTPNVRRILASQKTFANHFDDFLAMAALHESNHNGHGHGNDGVLGGGRGSVAAAAARSATPTDETASGRGGRAASNKRAAKKEAAAAKDAKRRDSKKRQSLPPVSDVDANNDSHDDNKDTPMLDASTGEVSTTAAKKEDSAGSASAAPVSSILQSYTGPLPTPHPLDKDPLLVSYIPPLPSDEELRALLAAPPLTYAEARAMWPSSAADPGGIFPERRYPGRVFCEVCGYWGRVKCTKCGTPVCALDCLEVHREDCITRYGL